MPETAIDTIIALASGGGRAGVAVVRVSGPRTREVVLALSDSAEQLPPPRQMCLRRLSDAGRRPLDDALVVWMPGPRSFTGEDVAEFHLHGSVAVVEAVVSCALSTRRCRRARAGEFTRRAVENGKLGLLRAEGLADLIDAETEHQRRAAFGLYDGGAERVFSGWREGLIEAIAALEAGIDFADESDIGGDMMAEAAGAIDSIRSAIGDALSDADKARAIRVGYRVAVVGRPNVGKSSLVNALAGRDAAMVSDVPGTTRDVVEIRLILAGHPVWIADTAGQREAVDALEAEGIARAQAASQRADLRVWVADASDSESVHRAFSDAEDTDFLVINKIDLTAAVPCGQRVFHTSVRNGTGLDVLTQAIAERVSEDIGGEVSAVSAHRRHCEILDRVAGRMARAGEAVASGDGAELAVEELRLAADDLRQLTGDIGAEDWLDRIFARFCIGK